jgi:hypothetical protein
MDEKEATTVEAPKLAEAPPTLTVAEKERMIVISVQGNNIKIVQNDLADLEMVRVLYRLHSALTH